MLPITTFVFDPPSLLCSPNVLNSSLISAISFLTSVTVFERKYLEHLSCLTGCVFRLPFIYSRRSLFQIFFFSWISSHCHFVLLCAYWNIRKFTTTILLLDHSEWRSICVIILDIVSGALEPITHYSNPN